MSITQIYQQFVSDIQYVHWQEWISTVAQLVSVWYAKKNNIWVYPTGIIGVILAAWVYYFIASPPLYADATLNIYYFVMSVIGWYNWARTKGDLEKVYQIKWCTKREWWLGLVGFLAAWIGIYMMLTYMTDSNTPILDALVSSSAITAMWWMATKKVENWIAWIFSNIVAIPLNFYKGFMLFTVMYVVFLMMAYAGFVAWKREAELR